MKTEIGRRRFLKSSSLGTLSALTCGLSDTLIAQTDEPPAAKPVYDCIVLGLGAMGSACLYQLAKRGADVLGLEQFDIAHALGSSGGISRQTKVAPYLGGKYEPLIRRANENWRALEKDSGQQVFHQALCVVHTAVHPHATGRAVQMRRIPGKQDPPHAELLEAALVQRVVIALQKLIRLF